ncbi:DUF4145 domain-containing protein [Parabacteroides sp. FAFU027]|uniref:DUF4145 domain-containing protein n=1 Tax=Parabacteroides sp. FAFU027 TaxID=2922715 RepID=UPI001FAEFCB6|nr:DUF4145 domain-containing protein [Parabacteroides sp. FAFU027]
MRQIPTSNGPVEIEGHPNHCPFCHQVITPNYLYGHLNYDTLEVILICPNNVCNKSFIGYYDEINIPYNRYYQYNNQTSLGNLKEKEFSETINSISTNFTLIYNQSLAAEQYQLIEICGVGYRKALEFLIKEYLIQKNKSEQEKIEKKLLGSCINEYVDDVRIKKVAKRAVWLGNDETHYIRKWEGKDLSDLKKLIDLTVHWIEMEALTKSFEIEMPE